MYYRLEPDVAHKRCNLWSGTGRSMVNIVAGYLLVSRLRSILTIRKLQIRMAPDILCHSGFNLYVRIDATSDPQQGLEPVFLETHNALIYGCCMQDLYTISIGAV